MAKVAREMVKKLESKSNTETAILVNDVSRILLKAIRDTKDLIFELSSPIMNEIGKAYRQEGIIL